MSRTKSLYSEVDTVQYNPSYEGFVADYIITIVNFTKSA